MPERGPRSPAALVRSEERLARTLGVPALYAITGAAIGSSIYFALGVVARSALDLTPIAFLVAAAFFAVTAMTYVEGSSLHPERGGASTFARYAFDELWSFVAGWAILLDYLIVIAIGAVALSRHLGAFWGTLAEPAPQLLVAALALAVIVRANVRGLVAARLGRVLLVQLLNGALLLAVIVAGIFAVIGEPRAGGAAAVALPSLDGFVFAAAVASAGLTGIEAASGLAGEIRPRARALRRAVFLGAGTVIALFVGLSVVALAQVKVGDRPTVLDLRYVEAPVLALVAGLEPPWLARVSGYVVAAVAVAVLLVAMNMFMLGLSRVVYSLATNRQIPAAVGRLHGRYGTPWVALVGAGIVALGLAATEDLAFLAALFAFGGMLSFALAHLSVIVLRFREPDLHRPFRVPLSIRVGTGSVPLPAVLGFVTAAGAWVGLFFATHTARIAGAAWMVLGLVFYLAYRRRLGESPRTRLAVAPSELSETGPVEYGSILVPIFGRPLDDDIMGTAGRLAAEEGRPEEGGIQIEALYVFEIPMALPLDAEIEEERLAGARRALARAKEVGEEYEGVEVATATTRARSAGAVIVEEARRRGVEAIVLAAEEPTRIRGGRILGGRGGSRDRFVGEVTREVIEHAPCRVIVTAPPAEDAGEREADPVVESSR